MASPRNSRNSASHERDEEEYWDGYDRRGADRRYHQVPPPYYQYPPQYMPPQTPQAPSIAPKDNVAQHTLTLQQLGGIVVVLGSVLVSGFSAWSNLNKELDIQRNNFDQFKTIISRDVDEVQSSMKELRRLTDEVKLQDQKTKEMLERRIQDLDTSLSQIYQKVSAK